MKYRLDVLNNKDFEDLTQALLEAELGISFQNFKSGKDGGIDLRYSENRENEIIVQAKHFIKSKFSDLKTALKEEKAKIDKLSNKPKRYIVTTTLALNPSETNQLIVVLHPYLKSTQDIYALDRIENLISKYDKIERKFYKLWITSTNTLEIILNNAACARNEFYEKKILERFALYVETTNLQEAANKLNENSFIIITGEPGVGKTTLSYILICDLMAQGYELIYIVDKIVDVDNLISIDEERKQVVFFDDFFGANLHDVINRNSESAIISLISRIHAGKNKFLILTSRTTILNQASNKFEKFNRESFIERSNYMVEVKNYSRYNKALILYNHLYHADLPVQHQEKFFEEKNYLKIIDHKNFFPRLIEFITSSTQFNRSKETDYKKFILNAFNNPTEIWRFAYEEQLEDEDRFLVCTLFSLGGYNINSNVLERAFEERYRFEISNNGFVRKSNTYKRSLRKLVDGIIVSRLNLENSQVFVSLLNPSIGDFLINFLRAESNEQRRILLSAKYFEQYTKYFEPFSIKGVPLEKNLLEELFINFTLVSQNMLTIDADLEINLTKLYIYLYYFEQFVTDEVLTENLQQMDIENIQIVQSPQLIYCLEFLMDYPSCKHYVAQNWIMIFGHLTSIADDSSDFRSIIRLLERYGIDRRNWPNEELFFDKLKQNVNLIFEQTINDIDLSSKEDYVYEYLRENDDSSAHDLIWDVINEDYQSFLNDCNLQDFENTFIEDVDFKAQHRLDDLKDGLSFDEDDDYQPRFSEPVEPKENEDDAIDNLFQQ
jgi:DNA polymerase III delta prime subunit